LNNEIEQILDDRNESSFYDYDWSQKINNITLQISKNFDFYQKKQDFLVNNDKINEDLQDDSVVFMILRNINENYQKLKIDLNKLCNIIIALQEKNLNYANIYQRLISTRNILLDKTKYKMKKLKNLISLVEKEKNLSPKFITIFQNVKSVDLYLSKIDAENKNFVVYNKRNDGIYYELFFI